MQDFRTGRDEYIKLVQAMRQSGSFGVEKWSEKVAQSARIDCMSLWLSKDETTKLIEKTNALCLIRHIEREFNISSELERNRLFDWLNEQHRHNPKFKDLVVKSASLAPSQIQTLLQEWIHQL